MSILCVPDASDSLAGKTASQGPPNVLCFSPTLRAMPHSDHQIEGVEAQLRAQLPHLF